uniref:Uncharacterized protein n=1 Tax=Romanomermis culicivorax TaxID=13658 RepID=A0A915KMZ5_ROMCU
VPVVEQNGFLGSNGSSRPKVAAVEGEIAWKILSEIFSVSAAESSILNEEEKLKLIGVLASNADLFVEATGCIRRAGLIKHRIDTGTEPPSIQMVAQIPESQRFLV